MFLFRSRVAAAHSYYSRRTDLGAIGSGRKLADEIEKRGLRVDVLVNNAGYGYAGPFDGSDIATQLGMIDLNDRTLVELTHAGFERYAEGGDAMRAEVDGEGGWGLLLELYAAVCELELPEPELTSAVPWQ